MKPFQRSFDAICWLGLYASADCSILIQSRTGFVWVYTHFYEASLFQSLTVEGYLGRTPERCITRGW